MLIDSHCHVLSSEYDNPDEIIKNAFLRGVNKIIINGYDLESSKEAVMLANRYDNVYAAVGVGPEEVNEVQEEVILEISCLADNKKVVAIGEIGLDYYWNKETKEKQKDVFAKMLKIAKEKKLPVIVHNREATKDVLEMLKDAKATGIMHCFSGSTDTAKELIKMGFLIGVGGVVTFKNAKKLVNVVKEISIDNISLETDSPYLTPEPYRGTKNDPSKVILVAEKIASLKGIDKSEVINKTGVAVASKFDL